MNRSDEYGRVLLDKAQEDLYVLERLVDDPQAPDAAVGFHAQQAVEKFLKAVLCSRQVRYPRTHDIKALLDLVRNNGLALPPEAEDLAQLTPYGTRLRYDRPLPAARTVAPLDRTWLRASVRHTGAWAEALLSQEGP